MNTDQQTEKMLAQTNRSIWTPFLGVTVCSSRFAAQLTQVHCFHPFAIVCWTVPEKVSVPPHHISSALKHPPSPPSVHLFSLATPILCDFQESTLTLTCSLIHLYVICLYKSPQNLLNYFSQSVITHGLV